jgi:hypothetical protein
MEGSITSFVTTTLVVDVNVIGGSGTIASWNIVSAGLKGDTGASGPSGPSGPAGPGTSITAVTSAETLLYPIMVTSGTAQQAKYDLGLSYNASTDALTVGSGSLSWTLDGSSGTTFALRDSAGTAELTVSNAGLVTATSFSGSGASLTSLNGSQITSGTISVDRLPPGVWELVGGSETTGTAMEHTSSTSVSTMTLSPGGIDTGDLLAIEVSSSSSTLTSAQRNIVFVRLGTNQTTTNMGMMSFGSLNSTTTGNQNVWSVLVRYLTSTSIGTRYGGFENLSATGNKTFGTFYIFRVWRVKK